MIEVIQMILFVLLILLAILLILIVVILSVRTGVEAVGVDGEVSVELRWGILRLPVYPPPKSKKPAKKPEKIPKKPESEKSKLKKYTLNREALDIGELINLALNLLDELTDTLRISRLRVRVLIGTPDAAKTGMLLGGAAAVSGMIVPFLENTFEMKDYSVSMDADFDAVETKWAFQVFCSLRPIQLVAVLLRRGKELYSLYKKLIRKEEAVINE